MADLRIRPINPMPTTEQDDLRRAALEYHEKPTPGKIAIAPTKQLVNQRDLALAYSPGCCGRERGDPRRTLRRYFAIPRAATWSAS